jgi:hypothetical protein
MERPESLSLSRLLSPPHSLAPTLKDAKAFPSSAPGWPFKTCRKWRYKDFDVTATLRHQTESDVASSTSQGCRRLPPSGGEEGLPLGLKCIFAVGWMLIDYSRVPCIHVRMHTLCRRLPERQRPCQRTNEGHSYVLLLRPWVSVGGAAKTWRGAAMGALMPPAVLLAKSRYTARTALYKRLLTKPARHIWTRRHSASIPLYY